MSSTISFFRRDLLHHHAQLELRDIADGNRPPDPTCQVAGTPPWHHTASADAAFVFHNDQIAVRCIVRQWNMPHPHKIAKSIEIRIQICFLLPPRSRGSAFACCSIMSFLTAIHDHAGTRKLGSISSALSLAYR